MLPYAKRQASLVHFIGGVDEFIEGCSARQGRAKGHLEEGPYAEFAELRKLKQELADRE